MAETRQTVPRRKYEKHKDYEARLIERTFSFTTPDYSITLSDNRRVEAPSWEEAWQRAQDRKDIQRMAMSFFTTSDSRISIEITLQGFGNSEIRWRTSDDDEHARLAGLITRFFERKKNRVRDAITYSVVARLFWYVGIPILLTLLVIRLVYGAEYLAEYPYVPVVLGLFAAFVLILPISYAVQVLSPRVMINEVGPYQGVRRHAGALVGALAIALALGIGSAIWTLVMP